MKLEFYIMRYLAQGAVLSRFSVFSMTLLVSLAFLPSVNAFALDEPTDQVSDQIHNKETEKSGPTLKKEVIVNRDVVTIGDLFDHADSHQHIAVFQAPDIGTDGVISAARIAQAVKNHGLKWETFGSDDKILVRRPSRLISLEEIKTMIGKHITQKSGLTSSEYLDVIFGPGARPIHLEQNNKAPAVITKSNYNPQNGQFRITLATEEITGTIERGNYQGQIIESAKIVVPTQGLEKGHILTGDDVKTVLVPVSSIQANFIKDTSLAIGKAAVKQLNVNQPIRREDVQVPKIVKINDNVDIRFRIPGLSLKAEGKAMEDGAKGQVIKVTNIQSKRVIEAVVIAPGIVSVSETQNNSVVTGSINIREPVRVVEALPERASEEALGQPPAQPVQ